MNFKEFWKYYSYGIVRIFIDQIAIAVFGVAVALGCAAAAQSLGEAKSQMFTLISGAFAALFFLFMVAELTFRQGVTDREKTELGRFKKSSLTGLYMGLLANVPNFILALGYTVFYLIEATKGSVSGFFGLACKLVMGEYLGILSIRVGESGALLSSIPYMYFVVIIPCLIAAFLGYFLGVNGIITPRLTKKDFE